MANAHLPRNKTLANFDFDFQPSIDRQVVAELSTLRFIEEKRNVLFVGPPGVGKSHLAVALGVAAVDAGYRAYFTTAMDLVANLQRNHERGSLPHRERGYIVGPPLLIIDEPGYLPMDQAEANWIFHVVSKRMSAVPSSSPATAALPAGRRSSMTQWWPPPLSIACFTGLQSSTFAATVTACVAITPTRPTTG